MNQISIKSSACNTPEVKIAQNRNKTCGKKLWVVTYLDFLHARIIYDGTLKKFHGNLSGTIFCKLQYAIFRYILNSTR